MKVDWRSFVFSLGVVAAIGTAGAASAQENSSWSLEVGVAGTRAATVPLDVALGPSIQVAGRTAFAAGQAGRVALGRQFVSTDDQGRPNRPWRLELEWWQHRADRESVSVGVLQLQPRDEVEHTAVMVNALVSIARSESQGQEGQPDWRAWLGIGLGQRKTRLPDASSIACQCLPARSDAGPVGQVKLQVERRLGESSFLQMHVTGLRINGWATEASRFPQTRYGDQSIGEIGVALRWVF